jgi:hypothetical protein
MAKADCHPPSKQKEGMDRVSLFISPLTRSAVQKLDVVIDVVTYRREKAPALAVISALQQNAKAKQRGLGERGSRPQSSL